MTFKVHEGQKEVIEAAIEKAMTEANTDVKTVALESICMDYVGGATFKSKVLALGLEGILNLASDLWPNATINVEIGDDPAVSKAA